MIYAMEGEDDVSSASALEKKKKLRCHWGSATDVARGEEEVHLLLLSLKKIKCKFCYYCWRKEVVVDGEMQLLLAAAATTTTKIEVLLMVSRGFCCQC